MFTRKTIGASKIRPKARAKLFLSAASRKMLITKENIKMKINEGAAEHINLSKLRSFAAQKPNTFLMPPQIVAQLNFEIIFILPNIPPFKQEKGRRVLTRVRNHKIQYGDKTNGCKKL
jgi:hypothetical protein